MSAPRQPLYATWENRGRVVHSPGSFRNGRVTHLRGWINAALGELAVIWVRASETAASDQTWAEMEIEIPASDADSIIDVSWDEQARALTVRRTARVAAPTTSEEVAPMR